MKIGICVDFPDRRKIAAAAKGGADFVELCLNSFETASLRRVQNCKAYLDRLGLPVLSYNGMFPWNGLRVTGQGVDYAKIDAYLENVLAKTDLFGAPYVVFGSCGARHMEEGDSPLQAKEDILRLFREHVIPAFQRHDRICVIEPLSEDNLIRRVTEGEEYVRTLSSPRLKLLADFYHTAVLKENITDYTAFSGDLHHFHIASPSNNRHIPLPGDGDEAYYREIFAFLHKIGYKGGVSVEGACGRYVTKEVVTSLTYLKALANA